MFLYSVILFCRRIPLPKSARLCSQSVLSKSKAALCDVNLTRTEINAVFVFFIELGLGNVALAAVDKKGIFELKVSVY